MRRWQALEVLTLDSKADAKTAAEEEIYGFFAVNEIDGNPRDFR